MPNIGCWALLLCSITNAAGLLKPIKQEYFIAGWISSAPEVMLKKWSPLFETYLTEQIGPLYDPPIHFKLVPYDYDHSNEAHVMVPAGFVDFAFNSAGGAACLETQFGYMTIATEVQLINGNEVPAYGSIIYSLKSNTAITNFSDFRGKRIGVGYPLAPGGFQLGAQFLDDMGLNIYTEFEQIIFYMNDYEALMEAVLLGHVDVAVTQSGWLEANFPEYLPRWRFHGASHPVFRSKRIETFATTKLVPNFALMGSPSTPLVLLDQVALVLRNLNASHPAAAAAGISHFSLPESYEAARNVIQRLGLMERGEGGLGWECLDVFGERGLEGAMICPPGHVLESPEVLAEGCRSRGRPCPAGTEGRCFCRPCHPDIRVNIFPWQLVMGLCCALFAVGLCFSVGWTSALQVGAIFRVAATNKPGPRRAISAKGYV